MRLIQLHFGPQDCCTDNPYTVAVHCVCHRLHLAVSQAAKDIPQMKTAGLLVDSIYNYVMKSPNRLAEFKAMEKHCAKSFMGMNKPGISPSVERQSMAATLKSRLHPKAIQTTLIGKDAIRWCCKQLWTTAPGTGLQEQRPGDMELFPGSGEFLSQSDLLILVHNVHWTISEATVKIKDVMDGKENHHITGNKWEYVTFETTEGKPAKRATWKLATRADSSSHGRGSGSEFLLHPYPCRITWHLLLCDPIPGTRSQPITYHRENLQRTLH
ncbi:hypothetical protein Bbelb_283560 [Branchiostoma belcheri]|nr:hypothetical protein Bbelb_283560 [Branchiostoma belcheri]